MVIAPVVLVTLALVIRDVVANPRPLAVPAYIRLHGLPWRRML